MPLISKPNYNQIFASQAPEQDEPAVFNNYPLGWGVESRPNNGKPTIKGFNYLQQTSDLKDLWILQNGAALPYDATMEYAEGAVVVKDGVLQQWKGGEWRSVNNKGSAIKFLLASEIGLTHWDNPNKKPPYTTEDYSQAFNNGINLSAAVKSACDAGYSSVILERGNYPVCYNRGSSGIQAGSNGRAIVLKDISDLELNLNGSTLFVIFDSENRSPYDTSTSSVYSMPGWVITATNTQNFKISNGTLRGDMYNRSWVSGENLLDNTVGIQNNINNKFLKLEKLIISGFRADALGGAPRGYNLFQNLTWSSGAYNITTGGFVEQQGAYSTQLLSLDNAVGNQPVLNNTVQLMTGGYTRQPLFRNQLFRVFCYKDDGSFISSQTAMPTQDIVLPVGTGKLIITAYDDERTTPTVDYGEVWLVTGSSSNASIEACTLFANNRGGVANFGSNTKVKSCKMFDFGSAIEKYGFKAYTDPTVYGINFEDVYNAGLIIDGNSFDNTGRGFIAITQDVKYINNREINQAYFNTVYATLTAHIKNNTLVSGGFYIGYAESTSRYQISQLTGNIVSNGTLRIVAPESVKQTVLHANNTYYNSSIEITANDNVVTVSNIYKDLPNRRGVAIVMRGIKSFGDFVDKPLDTSASGTVGGWRNIDIRLARPSKGVSGEIIFDSNHDNTASTLRLNTGEVLNFPSALVSSPTLNKRWLFALNTNTDNTLDKFQFGGGSFENIDIYFGASATRTYCNTEILFDGVSFRGTYVTISKNDTTASTTKILFRNCEFYVSAINDIVKVNNASTSLSTTDIVFENCRISSDTVKSFRIVTSTLASAKTTSILKDVKLSNINLNDTITTVQGQTKLVYDPPSLSASGTVGDTATTTVTMLGAAVGNIVQAAFSQYNAGVEINAVVSSANTVTVKFKNNTAAPIDLPSGTLTVKLI